jgi:hypothetical protein
MRDLGDEDGKFEGLFEDQYGRAATYTHDNAPMESTTPSASDIHGGAGANIPMPMPVPLPDSASTPTPNPPVYTTSNDHGTREPLPVPAPIPYDDAKSSSIAGSDGSTAPGSAQHTEPTEPTSSTTTKLTASEPLMLVTGCEAEQADTAVPTPVVAACFEAIHSDQNANPLLRVRRAFSCPHVSLEAGIGQERTLFLHLEGGRRTVRSQNL